MGLKNPTDVRKILAFFFVQNQDFSGENIFFDLSGSEIFDISESHGCKIWSIFKSGGRKFQTKLKSHGRKIWGLFFGNFVEEGNKKKKTKKKPTP